MLNRQTLSTRTLVEVSFALAIVVLPFNDLPYFQGVLGEVSHEAAFYPLAIGLVLLVINLLEGGRVHLTSRSSGLLLRAFIFWVILSITLNLPSILPSETKGRTGAEKALLQVVLLSFASLVAMFAYQVASRQEHALRLFRRYVLLSFIFAGAYSILEIASFLGVSAASSALAVTNPLFHSSTAPYVFGRVRSVSGEASWFAMYCSSALPWLLSYIFTERRGFVFYTALVTYLLALLVMSWSRTAYVIAAIQLMLFTGFLCMGRRTPHRGRLIALVAGGCIAMFAATSALRNVLTSSFSITKVFASLTNHDNPSNVARIGSQVAAYRIGIESPVIGIGLGQYGFDMPSHVPIWAQANFEMQRWMNIAEGTRWPPVHSLYARLAAETGLLGLALWISMWCALLFGCYKRYRYQSRVHGQQDILGAALLVSIVGLMLSQVNIDSFRIFSYWLTLGIGWTYMDSRVRDTDWRAPTALISSTHPAE